MSRARGPNCCGVAVIFWSEIGPSELAIAMRSGPIGVHNDIELAKKRKEEEGRNRCQKKEESHLSVRSSDLHLADGG